MTLFNTGLFKSHAKTLKWYRYDLNLKGKELLYLMVEYALQHKEKLSFNFSLAEDTYSKKTLELEDRQVAEIKKIIAQHNTVNYKFLAAVVNLIEENYEDFSSFKNRVGYVKKLLQIKSNIPMDLYNWFTTCQKTTPYTKGKFCEKLIEFACDRSFEFNKFLENK